MNDVDAIIPDDEEADGSEAAEDPEPMSEEPPPSEEEEETPPKEKEEEEEEDDDDEGYLVTEVMDALFDLARQDIPYFAAFPSGRRFEARAIAGTASRLFIQLLQYFDAHYLEEDAISIEDALRLTYTIRVGESHRIPKSAVIGDDSDRPARMARMKTISMQLATTHIQSNFFIAILESDGSISTFTGKANAPYNPSFHLFHRYCKGIIPVHPFVAFDAVAEVKFGIEQMYHAYRDFEKEGKESAYQAYVKILEITIKETKKIIAS